jgi:hypothetical protein
MKNEIVGRDCRPKNVVLLAVLAGSFFLATVPAQPAIDASSCSTSTESRQLDFWLGDWTVTYPGMPGSAASKVSLLLDKCLLIESWDGGKGHTGENMFAYGSDDRSWHGMFADNHGRVHMLAGKVAAGNGVFLGPSTGPDGRPVLNRVSVVRVSAEKVQQTWEKSSNNGVSWATEFQGEYSRKK